MDREKWLKERQKGLGGSDAAAVLGLNPYMTNVALWELKVGVRLPEDISEKPYVIYGQKAEAPLIELFSLDYPQYDVRANGLTIMRHSEYPFLLGTPDAILVDKETREMGILEIKTTNILQSRQQEKWRDRIPDNYYLQVLHYLLVTGYTFAILKAQLKTIWKDGDVRLKTTHFFIKREDIEKDISILLEKEIQFWNVNVLQKKQPALILPEI